VSIRQLMAHASGLPDYSRQPGFDGTRRYTPAEIIALVSATPPLFTAGARASASATDFFLLAQAVEHASGTPYEAFVTNNQIARLGLKNTVFVSGLRAVKQETLDTAPFKHARFLQDRPFIDPTEAATGYTAGGTGLVKAAPVDGSAWTGVGALYASAEDISLWDIGLAGGLLVSRKENRDILYAAASSDSGRIAGNAGWRFPGHKGLMDIEGSTGGFSCYLARFTDPGELLCVTLCGNRGGVDFTDLARRIAGAFDPKLGPVGASDGVTSRESTNSVQVTRDRLSAILGKDDARVTVWQEPDRTDWASYRERDRARTQLEAAVRYATAPY
jgi:D-alanyl-D-alanine carboxypeptidase